MGLGPGAGFSFLSQKKCDGHTNTRTALFLPCGLVLPSGGRIQNNYIAISNEVEAMNIVVSGGGVIWTLIQNESFMGVTDTNFGIITFTPHTSHPHSSLLIYTPAHPHILLLTRSGGGVMAWWSGGWLVVAWVHHHTDHRPHTTQWCSEVR